MQNDVHMMGSGNMHKKKKSKRTHIHKYGVPIRKTKQIICMHIGTNLHQVNKTKLNTYEYESGSNWWNRTISIIGLCILIKQWDKTICGTMIGEYGGEKPHKESYQWAYRGKIIYGTMTVASKDKTTHTGAY